MGSNIEDFFNLNQHERHIIWKAARAGYNPLTCALFKLYFPKRSQDEIVVMIREVGKVDEMAAA